MHKGKSFLKSIIIFIAGLVITVIVAYYAHKDNDKRIEQELEISANDIKLKIENRLNAYVQFSRTSSSFFMVSDTITRSDWKSFVDNSKISEHLKGFQGVAYIITVPNNQLQKHTQRFKQELFDNYTVSPNVSDEIITPIIYIEPIENRNLKALGYNISSNPLMRKALEESRDSNQVFITDKVILIQEDSTENQSGIVIYSPIYSKHMSLNTIEQRRVAIKGWVAMSLRMNDFMEGVIGKINSNKHNNINLQVYDGDSISNKFFLYDSKITENKNNIKRTSNTLLLTIELNNQKWTLQFTQPKTTFLGSLSFIVLLCGFLISLLLSFLMFFLLNTASFAKRMAEKLTIDLSDKNNELVAANNLLNESYSELKRAKEKSEESEEKLKLIANNLVNGMIYQVVMLDETKRKFTFVSDAVYQLYGCTATEAKDNPDLIYSKIHQDDIDNLIRKEKEALKEMSIFKSEVRVFNPDGSIRWSYYVSRPRIIDGLVCWDGIEVDITEQKKVENELQIAKEMAEESNHLKTEFLNNMSHEIRTPMNGILGFSDLLYNPNLSDEKQKSFISIIQSSAKQLMNIIDDIIEISRLGTKQVTVNESQVCLNDLLFELFSVFDIKAKENKTPLYLKKGLSNEQSVLITDESKLIKIISNLLENSLKFTSDGYIELGYQLKNEEIEIYVKDTGIGIDSEKHEIIFERFSQAEKDMSKKMGGLGLGLSIVKENVELLGGTIRLESKKESGSTFFVTIPYKPVYIEIESGTIKNKQTILIAEDEEVNYLYIETLLHDIIKLDCYILHAKNGLEAIEYCKNYPEIDLALIDLKMPIMDGYQAARQIRKLRPDLKIIAQTAYSTNEDKERAISVGCDDFISKPISLESFNNLIDKYL